MGKFPPATVYALPPSSSLPENLHKDVKPEKQFPSLKEVKKQAIQEAEYNLIREVLKETDWNRKKAAKILQISYKALLYKIKELGLRQGESSPWKIARCAVFPLGI